MLAPWGGSLLYEYVADVALLSVSAFFEKQVSNSTLQKGIKLDV